MIATSPTEDRATWLTVKEAAAIAKVSPKLIYLNIKQGRLRASRLGYRKDIRIRENWLEEWMVSLSTPHEITPDPAAGGPLSFKRHGRKAK
jgi:excisionase family DNA binding protein